MHVWTLITAMPPTVGHVALMDFMAGLGDGGTVVVQTQPHEPDVDNRAEAVRQEANIRGLSCIHDGDTIEQNPDTPGFQQMWVDRMRDEYGFEAGDAIVTSEPYGEWLAAGLNGVWIPFDMKREIVPSKASKFREHRLLYLDNQWNMLAPAYRRLHRKVVTTFGAESCGKTTLAKRLTEVWNGAFKPEWARGYLEAVGPEVTNEKMHVIFKGQWALQGIPMDKPFVFQDTDLFSTIGYWRMYDPEYYATVKDELESLALTTKSDLYVVCSSDIPFEPDQLRYGGDKRESTDQYWIDLLEEFGLNYVVYKRDGGFEVGEAMHDLIPDLRYDRKGY